jgi:nitroreductase
MAIARFHVLEVQAMPLADLVAKNRSYRRFFQDHDVPLETLKQLVAIARLTPSAGNAQPLKYFLSANRDQNAVIFPHISWAAQLKDWHGPQEGERPSAYVIILGDKRLKLTFGYADQGIVAQTILLGATEIGLGGVIIGSVRKDELAAKLALDPQLEILLVLALGKPKEEVVIEALGADGSTSYWRDNEQRHHVPKRAVEDLIVAAS